MSALLKSTRRYLEAQRKSSKMIYFVGMSILFSGLINLFLPARVFFCIVIILAILIGNREVLGRANKNYILIPILLFSCAAFYINFIVDTSPVVKEVLTRLTILFPLSVIFGYVVTKSQELKSFSLGYSLPVYFTTLLIPYELFVAPLLTRNPNYFIADRFGFSRIAFFVEHPLILGAHLTLIASFLILNISPRGRVFTLILVIASISTLSLGPSLIILGLLILRRFSLIRNIGKYLVAITTSLLALFIFAAVKGISSDILTLSTFGISINYRAIIYGNLIPKALSENPIGFGLGGLQEGLYRVNLSNYSVDMAKSVDSQPALLVLQGGWLLLIPYLMLCVFLLRRAWESDYRAYPALVSILLGFFVPIQAFTSSCVIQGILIGMAFLRRADVNK